MGMYKEAKSHISVSSTHVAMKSLQAKHEPIQNTKVLPNEIWNKEILPYLSDTDKSHFTQTCQNAYALGCVSVNGQTFYNQYLHTTANKMKTLLLHVARGEQAEAEAMIRKDPGLLLIRSQTKDYSSRIVEGTALQVALGAEDVKYHDNEICMVEMIQSYLEKMPNGKEIQAAQIREQFPEGWETEEKAREQRDSAALHQVVDAIAQATENNPCDAAIRAFQGYLEQENKSKVYQTGKHFNMNLLLEAFELYKKKFNEFGDFPPYKNAYFWVDVIGYTQRFLPACYAQACSQVPGSIVGSMFVRGENLNRIPRQSSDVIFYPLDSNPERRLGFQYANGGSNLLIAGGLGASPSLIGSHKSLIKYINQKTLTLQRFTLEASVNEQTMNRCNIM